MQMAKAVLLLALVMSIAAHADTTQTVYRWVDEKGRVQFGERPPSDGPVSTLEFRVPEKKVVPEEETKLEVPTDLPLGMTAARRAEKCVNATSVYEALAESEYDITMPDAAGNNRKMTTEERKDLTKQQQWAVNRYCTPLNNTNRQ